MIKVTSKSRFTLQLCSRIGNDDQHYQMPGPGSLFVEYAGPGNLGHLEIKSTAASCKFQDSARIKFSIMTSHGMRTRTQPLPALVPLEDLIDEIVIEKITGRHPVLEKLIRAFKYFVGD